MRIRSRTLAALLVASVLATTGAPAWASEPAPSAPEDPYRHALELSPMSFLFRIYAVQYAYHFSPQNELITGVAYQNIQHPFGYTSSPTVILGYRRYLWGNFSVEYQLWPAYDWYYSNVDQQYFNGWELWNEARAGYRFDFNVLGIPSFVSLQWLFGFGLWPGNKPTVFLEAEKKERFFTYPLLMFGTRF